MTYPQVRLVCVRGIHSVLTRFGSQGVWEKDEIRKHDSFITFEEILQYAKDQAVDLVLLGGDLFHDNKPSRSTVVRAIEILTKYSLSDKPVNFQVLSNQSENFASG